MVAVLGARSTADDVLRGRDLTDQNVLVTGCNAGIGYETARALAAHGAHVFVACREPAKANATVERIRTSHPGAQLTAVSLDLSAFASIRAAVDGLSVDVLHALICNAGLFSSSYRETAEGFESTVGVCHFGHFLLTTLLLDKLRRAAPGRVVMVGSESHRHPAQLDLTRFPLQRGNFKPLVAYGQAKLCNTLFANELTRRHASEGVFANSLHPGSMIGTSIFRSSIPARLLALAAKPFAKTIEQGAATSVFCATAPELATTGGQYYSDCRVREMSRGARDVDVAARLWQRTDELVARAD
ncbi:MAG TPA: SDR family oxidoreductase [Polyangiales bacterium]|nr:SDR family oxidoreductase [Polyangiales bacterium]